jgi:hypothetical protein
MHARFKNPHSVVQVVPKLEWYRPFPLAIPPGGLVEARNAREEKYFRGLVGRGILVEVDPNMEDESAVQLVVEPYEPGPPDEPLPRLRLVGTRRVIIHDDQGNVIADVIPGQILTGWKYFQFRSPHGPFRYINPPPPRRITTLTTEK